MSTNRTATAKKNSLAQKQVELREQLWPGSSDVIWDIKDPQQNKGFAQIPRVLPWVMHLIKHLANKGDPSRAYFELWCRDFGQGLVEIKDYDECAFASGYTGTRATRTWKEHIYCLAEMKFIAVQAAGNREFGNVLLFNPLIVSKYYQDNQAKSLPDGWWNSLLKRASEIKATVPKDLGSFLNF